MMMNVADGLAGRLNGHESTSGSDLSTFGLLEQRDQFGGWTGESSLARLLSFLRQSELTL